MISFKGLVNFLIAAMLMVLTLPAFGKKPDIRFVHIQKKDGLSSNTINDIVKDQLGFIWVATTDGLCRYDAHDKIQTFYQDPKNPNKLQTDNIRSLLSDSKGNVWIGTRLGGLTRHHPLSDSWTTFRYNPEDANSLSNDEVLSLLEDSYGRIWVGTENGLNVFNPESETFTVFKADTSTPQALQGKAILSIMEDHRAVSYTHLRAPRDQRGSRMPSSA